MTTYQWSAISDHSITFDSPNGESTITLTPMYGENFTFTLKCVVDGNYVFSQDIKVIGHS